MANPLLRYPACDPDRLPFPKGNPKDAPEFHFDNKKPRSNKVARLQRLFSGCMFPASSIPGHFETAGTRCIVMFLSQRLAFLNERLIGHEFFVCAIPVRRAVTNIFQDHHQACIYGPEDPSWSSVRLHSLYCVSL